MRALDGKVATLESILEDERSQEVVVALDNQSIVRQLTSAPSRQFVTKRHAASKAGKGVGEGLLTSEAHRAWAT